MSANLLSERINGRYEPVSQLGMGGMGVVYKVLDHLTRQHVALKRVLVQPPRVLILDITPATNFVDRDLALAQEFQTLASLRHAHIISVLDYGFDRERRPYFTMERLDRPQTILEAGRGQPLKVKIQLLIQTLQALVYLHRRGILHRDLKPGNVLVIDGQVKVVDLGLAAAQSSPSVIVGTLAYIAPEILRGELPTPAIDLYAIGVIAYELIANRYPFDLNNPSTLITDILEKQPDLSPLRGDLADLDSDNAEGSAPSLESFGVTKAIPSALTAQPATDLLSDELLWRAELERATTLLMQALPPGQLPNTPEPLVSAPIAGGDLVAVVGRLLSKRPEDRYSDAESVIRALNSAIGEPIPLETTAIRESFLQAAHFVGRENELARLTTALLKTISGQGSLWLIAGESGVGKSRLLDEVRIRALVKGTLVLRGQARLNGTAYEVWREPLQRLVLNVSLTDADATILKAVIPNITELLDKRPTANPSDSDSLSLSSEAEQAQSRLLEAIVSLINRQTQPIVIILEDLQWAGSESVALVQQISQLIEQSPLLILGSYRDDEMPELPTMLATAQVLRLQRLSEQAIAQLSISMLGKSGEQPQVLELLQRETEGNVFFLIETVRALAEEAGQLDRIGMVTLPKHVFTGGMQRILQRRLARLAVGDVPMLQMAAVLGRQLDLAVLRSAGFEAMLDAWLLRCADATILEVRDERWRFSHDKLREGILSGLSSKELSALHRKAAEAIEKAYSDRSEQSPALAEHWREAGEPGQELRYSLLAGTRALQLCANPEAAAYFQRALTLLSGMPDSVENKKMRLEALLHLATAQMFTGAYTEAQEGLLDVLALGASLNDSKLTADALALLGRIALDQSDFAQAIRYIDRSRELYRTQNDRQGIATDLVALARMALYQGRYAEASAFLTESLSLFRQVVNPIGTAQALSGLGNLAIAQGEVQQAIQRLDESLALYRAANYRNGIGSALLTLGWATESQNRYAEAADHYSKALAVYREIGVPSGLTRALNNLGYVTMLQHNYSQARAWFEEGLIISRRIGDQFATATILTNLGHDETLLHAWERARQFFREAFQIARTLGAVPLILEVAARVAKLELGMGNWEHAAQLCELVMAHPALNPEVRAIAQAVLAELKTEFKESRVAEAGGQDKSRDLQAVVQDLLK